MMFRNCHELSTQTIPLFGYFLFFFLCLIKALWAIFFVISMCRFFHNLLTLLLLFYYPLISPSPFQDSHSFKLFFKQAKAFYLH